MPYSPPFKTMAGTTKNKHDYHLITDKEVVIAGRKHNRLYFASLIGQKGFVGFYFMPIYGSQKLKDALPPELRKLLKGKACFHVKWLTPGLKKDISAALEAGYKAYAKMGWI